MLDSSVAVAKLKQPVRLDLNCSSNLLPDPSNQRQYESHVLMPFCGVLPNEQNINKNEADRHICSRLQSLLSVLINLPQILVWALPMLHGSKSLAQYSEVINTSSPTQSTILLWTVG